MRKTGTFLNIRRLSSHVSLYSGHPEVIQVVQVCTDLEAALRQNVYFKVHISVFSVSSVSDYEYKYYQITNTSFQFLLAYLKCEELLTLFLWCLLHYNI